MEGWLIDRQPWVYNPVGLNWIGTRDLPIANMPLVDGPN
jgi:hypothetical protein